MRHILFFLVILSTAVSVMACSEDPKSPDFPETPESISSIETPSETMNGMMFITINGKSVSCRLVDNAATRALHEKLSEGDLSYNAHEYGGFEMVGSIGFSLPASNAQLTAKPGDVVLYNDNNICIFAGQNSWSYTYLGRIEGMSDDEIRAFLCLESGDVTVTFSAATKDGLVKINTGE